MTLLCRAVVALLLASAGALAPGPARAQDYPKAPVVIVFGFPAGSTGDIAARAVANEMSETLGQRFVVENRPGAASSTAAASVARAPRDGYTLFVSSIANVINAAVKPDLPFDFVRDFEPITLLTSTPVVLVTGTEVGARSVKDLLQLAKRRPEPLLFGSSGTGSSTHLALELFKTSGKVNITHVPYTGSPGVVTDLLANRIHAYFAPASSVMEHVRVGKLVALGVTDARRSAFLPELPTIAEAGIPGFEAALWFGLMAPAGTPQPIVDTLSRAANEALQSEKVREAFQKQFIAPLGGTPADFRRTIAEETARWTTVVAATGLKRP
ncbi:MAG TPA: tripartite tricarboxylate transporter substrate binding protein [Hyphomicrobiaceae bacterium]|jgi:tripartite-type tricarboxylate transporter receptor subunit TctC|nr:tripartite tricarboxylate transporter substrate binding protein [Hyphomicrobiaceae bacterium]